MHTNVEETLAALRHRGNVGRHVVLGDGGEARRAGVVGA